MNTIVVKLYEYDYTIMYFFLLFCNASNIEASYYNLLVSSLYKVFAFQVNTLDVFRTFG